MYGIQFDLKDDSKILKINSPKCSVGGPYKVVYKNINERWVIIAFDWEKQPRLGIRWFWGNGGNPFSSAHATWLVIPTELNIAILNGLPLDTKFRNRIELFLNGSISGKDI